jgi:CubicO group peptidase (beta-lactamase class C family)
MSTIDPQAVDTLLERVRREIDEGALPSCQVALALDGEVVVEEAFGQATTDTRYVAFSCTKPFVAGVIWLLMAEGAVDIAEPIIKWVPEFATNGKDAVTLEQVLLHTGGFPTAPMGPPEWSTSEGRRARFAQWRLNFEPGSRYVYHPTSGHWVLAEVIEAVTGSDYRDAVEERITSPLGLPRVLGIPADDQDGIAAIEARGTAPTPDEWEAAIGIRDVSSFLPLETGIANLCQLNEPEARAVGVPGGGGVMRAADLALFYQVLLHDPKGVWPSDLLADVTGRVRLDLPDPMGVPANRSLGLILAGDDGRAAMRGFGRTASPRSFGHNGAGGQIAFADPDTGLSVAYLTNGLDEHLLRQYRRDTAIASRAALCAVA